MNTECVVEVIDALIGCVEPIGETNTDDRRYTSLLKLEEALLAEINTVEWLLSYEDHYAYSMSRSGKEARRFLKNLRDEISEVLGEQNEE